MLSYQHMYHAGSLADVHKHILLARALTHLMQGPAPLLYAETHAGRGRYNLDAPEARKTGEAAAGIDTLLRQNRIAEAEPFMAALRKFQGPNNRLYPGSPALAASLLRRNDALWLWELHPREHAVLARLFERDRRAMVFHANGQIGLPFRLPPKPPVPSRGLVLIDPSYEIKDEFSALPGFVRRLRLRWPQTAGILWYPMLPAGRHQEMVTAVTANQKDIKVHEAVWSESGASRGLYGSGALYWGIDQSVMAPATFVLENA
jgi:23S rRNA (adenine2030-N6)-methyltransferase